MVAISTVPTSASGTVRCGSRASPAAVETASKPMKAKNSTPAPRRTPDSPNSPNAPSLGGTNGVQFAVLTKKIPTRTTSRSEPTLSATIALLAFADSREPRTSSHVQPATTSTAGRLTGPVSGTWMPTEASRLTA